MNLTEFKRLVEKHGTVTLTLAPLLVGDETAAVMIGLSPSYFREMAKAGRIGPEAVRLGRRRLWRVDDLKSWVAACRGGRNGKQ